jgi:hypothetical protein
VAHRTVVILYNDDSREWIDDPELGRKIAQAAAIKTTGIVYPNLAQQGLEYGEVVECIHADTDTLAYISSYRFVPLARQPFPVHTTTVVEPDVELLRAAAKKMGFDLVPSSK